MTGVKSLQVDALLGKGSRFGLPHPEFSGIETRANPAESGDSLGRSGGQES